MYDVHTVKGGYQIVVGGRVMKVYGGVAVGNDSAQERTIN